MLKKGFEEAEVEVEEETDALLAEIEGAGKEEKTGKEEISTEGNPQQEPVAMKPETRKPEGE